MPTTCLILEDDFVLRSTTETLLRDLGVDSVASFDNVADVLAYLAGGARPDAAVIDYRLGRLQTSEDAARALVRLGIPTAFVTGLGEVPDLPEPLARLPVLAKPVSAEAMRSFLGRAEETLDPGSGE